MSRVETLSVFPVGIGAEATGKIKKLLSKVE